MDNTDEKANFNVIHIIFDFFVIISVYVAVYFATDLWDYKESRIFYAIMLITFCIIYFLFMYYFKMYNMSTFLYTNKVLRNTSLSFIFSTVTVFMLLFLAYNTTFSRIFLLFFISITFIMLNIEKLILIKLKGRVFYSVRVIYVGNASGKGKTYENFIKYAKISGYDFTVLGYINTNGAETRGEDCLGDLKDFESILRKNPCDHVVFALSLMERWDLEPFLKIAQEMGIVSRILFDVYNFDNYQWFVSIIGSYPMITYYNISLDQMLLKIKRIIDLIGSTFGIILSFPLLVITAIAIKIDSPGPVIFKQERVGLHGQKFNILKFRSMYIDAEERKQELMAKNEMSDSRLFKIKDDPRITKIGKIIRRTSIDELPQLFNVFSGKMSLVGTRPPTVSEVEQYDRQHYRRISIKPGITGIWQTSGRNKITDFEEIVKMDVTYIENWSLLLDIKLLLKTIVVLVSKNGAY